MSGSYTGFTGDYTELTKVYPMNDAIKVGSASASGSFKTPALSTITGDNATLRVTVKAAGWNNKSATLQVLTRHGTTSPDAAVAIASEATMSGNAPTMIGTEYVWTITGASAETAIQFITNLAIGFDEILVEQLVPAE
jgi:phage protein D